ncbi:MAG: acyl-CoA thioesterase [Nitrospirae bacterium]|nr:acyl-CoA thioesterase [Nitrospirota bacterium]
MLRYHFRLLWVYLVYRFRPNRSAVTRYSAKVRYRDCDINGHMNNAVYLFYLDEARFDHFFRSGLFHRLREVKARPVVGRVDISYRRELRPRQRFTIESFTESIEGKLVYVRHNFYVGATLHASANAGQLILQNGKVIDPSFLTDMIHHPQLTPAALSK